MSLSVSPELLRLARDPKALETVLALAAVRLKHRQAHANDPPAWHADVHARLRVPHPEQQRFIEHPAPRKIIRAGRRGGKTVGVAIPACQAFLAGQRVLYAVPTQDQLEQFWFEVKRAFEPAIDANKVYKNETLHLIEIPGTKTRIRAKTAWNADTLRGDYADLLILDEWQLMNEDAWETVGQPMLIDNNGKALFIYTPPSFRNAGVSKAHDPRHAAKLFQRAMTDGSGEWAAFHFTSLDNPHNSVEGLEAARRNMSDVAYRQEILAEDLESVPGALWTPALLDRTRVRPQDVPVLTRIGVALDPSATSSDTADEMGIIAGGVAANGHAYTLKDVSMRGTPSACARVAIQLYDELEADVLIGEGNNGGEWIGTVINLVAAEMHRRGERPTPRINYKMVHATRNKQTRAEPVATLYEQGTAHHVGLFPLLEEECTTYVPGAKSPNRMDAEVWLWSELALTTPAQLAGVW